MRFGVCCPPEASARYEAIGFDFVEWSVAGNVGTVDDAAFGTLVGLAGSLRIRPEAWNVLLPGSIRVTGPDIDDGALRAYLETALPRVRTLGGEVVVFGSGRSRSIPDGFDGERARGQFMDACRIVAEVAEAKALTISLEPLRVAETNLVNRIDEGAEVVREVAMPSFRLLADHFHMLENGEDESAVATVGEILAHVHIAAAGTRLAPLAGADVGALGRFCAALKGAGYTGRISFETRDVDPETYGEALAVLREAWDAA